MSEPTLVEVLTRAVEKHLPTSKAVTSIGSVKRRRNERWAKALLDADFHCDDRFGVSRDAPALEDIVRAAQQLRKALQAVSWPTAKSPTVRLWPSPTPTTWASGGAATQAR